VSELLTAARAAARAASTLLRDARPDRIKSKSSPRDLVTEWDVKSEEVIRRVLEEHAPGIPVIGEVGASATRRASTGSSIRSTAP
jgi:fructose-1,6-bisphosphatase/inositol monophosphatase family enzyme